MEVEDVRTARMLATKLEASESLRAEVSPEGGVGARRAQGPMTDQRDVHACVLGTRDQALRTGPSP